MAKSYKRNTHKQMKKLMLEELGRMDTSTFKASKKFPVVLILDNIRSASNVGAMFRTADAFKIESISLCGLTACPPHKEIFKTALGAEDSVHWQYFTTTQEAAAFWKQQGYVLWGLEQTTQSVLLGSARLKMPKEPVALIVGNEVDGVDLAILEQCHQVVEIPQAGTKHSLNVSVAASVALWELCKSHLLAP